MRYIIELHTKVKQGCRSALKWMSMLNEYYYYGVNIIISYELLHGKLWGRGLQP